MSKKDEVAELIDILQNHEDPWRRAEAALALADHDDDERIFEPLFHAMENDKHDFVRRDCAEAFGIIEDPRAVDALIHTMKTDPFRYTRNEAVEALGHIGDHRAKPAIIEFMRHEDWSFGRASAAIALAEMKAVETIEIIIEELDLSDDEFLRLDMLRALHKFKSIKTRPLIHKLVFEDKSWEIRKLAVEMMVYFPNSETIEVLVEVLKTDVHVFVRQAAEQSLQMIAHDKGITWTTAEALLARQFEFD